MYMRNKKNKIITILMTLILLVCMPVTEVYAGTSTKTYGTDAFGETNGYLRLSQGTIKSCKYSKNGASAKTVTGDKRYVTGLSTLFQTNFFRLFFRYCTGV